MVLGPRLAVVLVLAVVAGVVLLFVLLDPAQSPPTATPTAEDAPEEPIEYAPVEASLVADVTSVHAGETFHAGILLRIRPGWHVFWKDPGEAGIPTTVDLRVPATFTRGDLQWPVPVGFRQPGDLLGYGYADWVILAASVQAPRSLPAGQGAPIRAHVEWLTCERLCEPGKADLELMLPLGGDRTPTDVDELFASWERRLPIAFDDPDQPLSIEVEPEAEGDATTRYEVALNWKQPPESIEWFPVAIADLQLLETQPTDSSTTHLSFLTTRLTANGDAPHELDSVLAYTDSSGMRRGVELRIPLADLP